MGPEKLIRWPDESITYPMYTGYPVKLSGIIVKLTSQSLYVLFGYLGGIVRLKGKNLLKTQLTKYKGEVTW